MTITGIRTGLMWAGTPATLGLAAHQKLCENMGVPAVICWTAEEYLHANARVDRLSRVSKSGLPGFGKKLCENKGL